MSLGGMVRVFFEFSLGFSLYFIRTSFKNIFSKSTDLVGLSVLAAVMSSIIFFDTMWLLFLPSIALLIVYLGTVESSISRALSKPLLVYFGNISFSLYMWHWIIIQVQNWMRDKGIIQVGSEVSIYVVSFGMVLASIVIAHFSYLYIEKPSRRWCKRLIH